MKRRTLFFGIVMAAAVIFTGCGKGTATAKEGSPDTGKESSAKAESDVKPEKEKSGKSIVYITPLIGHPVWLDAKLGFETAAKELGYKTQWVGPEGIDMDSMVQQIELAMAQDIEGIITCPLNPSAFETVYKQAQEKGIPIVNNAVDSTSEDLRLSFIGTDNVNYGISAADILGEKLGGSGKVIVMQGSMDAENQNTQFNSFEKTLKEKYPEIEIIVRESDDSDMLKAVDKFNTILQNNPDANAILCLEASAGPAAAKVLAEKDLVDKVTVLAIDDMEDTLAYIKSGEIWGTLAQNFYKMGYDAVQAIDRKNKGETVESVVDSGVILITEENVDTYKEK